MTAKRADEIARQTHCVPLPITNYYRETGEIE